MVVWDQPINGWELVISSLFGVLVTVGSVWVGIRFALRQERATRLIESLALDKEVVRARIPDFLSSWSSALLPMWFNGTPNIQQDEAPSIRDKWRPSDLESLVEAMPTWLPPSHLAIYHWLKEQTDGFIAYANLEFKTAANSEMREQYMAFEKDTMDPLRRFSRGVESLEWFQNSGGPRTAK